VSKLVEAPPVKAQTVVGVFRSEVAAREAMRMLETAGMPPDRIGIVMGNVRQAREVAGSYSPQGAFIGALVGALLVASYLAFGGETVRQNTVAVVIGGVPIIGGLAFIGWLAGRARVFKDEEYEKLEDDVEKGEILISVVCDTPEGADVARATLERAHAEDVRLEDTADAV
jgi:hypothetical protein